MPRSRTPAPIRRRRAVAWGAFVVASLALALTLLGMLPVLYSNDAGAQSSVRPPASAVQNAAPAGASAASADAGEGAPTLGRVPGNTSGISSDADLWRFVAGREVPNFDATVSIPNKQAAVLVQAQGEAWRLLRRDTLPTYGAYALGGILAALALFFLLRGRIRIEHGRGDRTIERFNGFERFGHWLLATSFIALAFTGLNLVYGRDYILPLVGPEMFGTVSVAGKWLHNNIAWAFMLALVIVFVMWVAHNLPSLIDLKWLAKGGGLLTKGVHPDARKFNAGQKLIFWSVIILGVSVSLSGIALLFPFETAMMAKTFVILNNFGFDLPTTLTAIEEMQYQTVWHAIVAFAMIVIVIAHIYIGSVGMEGAFAAMGNGQVDLNWAREHHNLWVDEHLAGQATPSADGGSPAAPAPAE